MTTLRPLLRVVLGVLAVSPALAADPLPPETGRAADGRPVSVRRTPRLEARMIPAPGGAFAPGDCPNVVSSLSDASFEGGSYIVQAGFAEQEIAAASYVLSASDFPIILSQAEMIFATSNTNVQTTTHWSFLVWEGTPTNGNLVAEFSSDDVILPHLVIPPGTNGVNVLVAVDPGDPDQIVITDNGTHTFTIGYRIDQHHNQTQNPCLVGPPSSSNAFPTTDTSGLASSTNNWLFGVNCGVLGCPPNGGWARFSQLSVLCRPSGDWVMRATWRSVSCGPGGFGACCLPTGACSEDDPTGCAAVGGIYQGDNVLCINANCPDPVGACCVAGSCIGVIPAVDCAAAGGTWQGAGSTCGQANCNPPGACCFPASGGCVNLSQGDCSIAGGIWNPGSCTVFVCFPSGACCLPDGSCEDGDGAGVDPDECVALGGVFQGDGVACGAVSCPVAPGACCFPSTGGCLVLSIENCTVAGGVFAGGGSTCMDGNMNGSADACEPACPADFDGSGAVDFADLLQVLSFWGTCGAPCPEDLDDSGAVDFADLLQVLSAWGPC